MISNTWKYIKDNYVDLGLMAICFCMPFKVLLLSRVIMFTLLLSIIHAIINRKSFSVSKQHIQKVAVIMLLLSVNGISLIYSTDKAYAFKLGSTIVGLFTLPFIFLIYKPNLPGKFYFNSFLLGTATASLIMIISFQINHGFIEVFKKAADSTYSY
ncbi:MAG: hypothetical protein MI922_03670, partial [Bacteroidales bacterium]|nr:hypothetical protein [Bacteroidales bacterium]